MEKNITCKMRTRAIITFEVEVIECCQLVIQFSNVNAESEAPKSGRGEMLQLPLSLFSLQAIVF